jgi:hypothetical protein
MSRKLLLCVTCVLLFVPVLHGQENGTPTWSPRLFLDGDIGNRVDLGFMLPSSDLGVSFEFPMWRRFELQGYASFSPDRKGVTDDGASIVVGQTEVLWITRRFGLTAACEWHSLWTSQFTKRGWHPFTGIVLRDRLKAPGRLYVNLSIPVGCVWATPSAPCPLQSNRLVGPTITQEWQIRPHIRFTVQGGVYHFCDQGNPNDQAAGRICQWANTEMLGLRFEFPAWRFGNRGY